MVLIFFNQTFHKHKSKTVTLSSVKFMTLQRSTTKLEMAAKGRESARNESAIPQMAQLSNVNKNGQLIFLRSCWEDVSYASRQVLEVKYLRATS